MRRASTGLVSGLEKFAVLEGALEQNEDLLPKETMVSLGGSCSSLRVSPDTERQRT